MGAGMSVVTENLVEGVEQMRLRIGIDSNDDGEADRFVTADTAGIDWSTVSALELNLLLRGTGIDAAYTDTRTYDLAGLSLTPGGAFRRLLVNKSVSLRLLLHPARQYRIFSEQARDVAHSHRHVLE